MLTVITKFVYEDLDHSNEARSLVLNILNEFDCISSQAMLSLGLNRQVNRSVYINGRVLQVYILEHTLFITITTFPISSASK